MPSRRDLALMLFVSALFLGVAADVLSGGLNADWLLLAPLVVLVVPLLGGRYVGEEQLARLRSALSPPPHRKPVRGLAPVAPRRAPELVALRGRLVARVHASRPPPARLLITA